MIVSRYVSDLFNANDVLILTSLIAVSIHHSIYQSIHQEFYHQSFSKTINSDNRDSGN